MYFEATLSNGNKINFEAKGPDEGIEYGNNEADKKKLIMVAIKKLTKTEAEIRGLTNKTMKVAKPRKTRKK